MKPASIIVLIIAAILVIFGIVLCLIGNSTAAKDGMELFPQIKNGVPYIKQEFTADKTSKIELSVSDATINLIGGEISSYVEFVNYNPNLYDLDVTSQTISFDEAESLKSLFNIWENGFGFKGYRNLLNPNSLKVSGDKTINVHLADSSLLSSITIKGNNVVLNIDNVQIKKEFRIDAETVIMTADGFTAGPDGITINSTSLDGKFNSVSCGLLKSETDSIKLTSSSSDIRQIELKTDSGSIDIENMSHNDSAEFDFTTKTGTITIDGEVIEGFSYSVKSGSDDKQFSYRIKTGSAHISYKNVAEEIPEPDESVETESVEG